MIVEHGDYTKDHFECMYWNVLYLVTDVLRQISSHEDRAW